MIGQKTWPPGGGAYFPIIIYICIENIKILLVKYLLTDFNDTLVTLYQECSSNPDLSKNMAARGVGLIFPIDLQYSQRDIPIDLGRHHDQFFRHGVASSCHRDERDSWRDAQVFSARHCSNMLSETLIRP